MNRMLTSAIALGAGMAAYNYARKNKMITNRQMRKMKRRLTKEIF